MVTLEDIEDELNPEKQSGTTAKLCAKLMANRMDALVKKLKMQESLIGSDFVKAMILGNRKLNPEEYAAAVKKFGTTGIKSIEVMEHLNKAQKQYIFKRMGYDIAEVV